MSNQEEVRAKYELLKPCLKGRVRRLWAASEAEQIGRGGIKRVAEATGMSCTTVSAGIRELHGTKAARCSVTTADGAPHYGRGQPSVERRDPAIMAALEKLLTDEIAGDPMSEQRWVRCSLRQLSRKLKDLGHRAGRSTVSRLLKKLKFSLRANKKKRAGSRYPGRDEQFNYIALQKKTFLATGWPLISVDTKKKELIGNFKNKGQEWCREAAEVNDYGFPSAADCLATPFGVNDVAKNLGYVTVGLSHNTPEFTVSAIARWWESEGCRLYSGADQLLILADGGGGNGSKSRAWKHNLQVKLCDRFGLTVTVGHYPTGCSKWNPVEYRLFSQISMNWAGKPLRTLGVMLGYIRGTATTTGLKVEATLGEGVYKKGQKVTRQEMERLNITFHETCSHWNDTIRPRQRPAP